MSVPVDYRICQQTVTVYRYTEGTVLRRELRNCFLVWEEEENYSPTGKNRNRKFLLIQPGNEQLVFPGDRVHEGIGPEIAPEDWSQFIPALYPKLGEANYAVPYCWQGVFCHTEAGRR